MTCNDCILGGAASQQLNCESCQDYDIMMHMHREELEDQLLWGKSFYHKKMKIQLANHIPWIAKTFMDDWRLIKNHLFRKSSNLQWILCGSLEKFLGQPWRCIEIRARTANRLCYCVLPKNWNLMWRRKLKLYLCAYKIWFSGSVLESMGFFLPSEMRSAVHIAQIAGHWDETIHQQGFVVQHVPFDHKWPGWGNDQQRPTRSLESRTCRKQHMSVLVWEKWGCKIMLGSNFKKTSKMLHLWSTGGGSRHR